MIEKEAEREIEMSWNDFKLMKVSSSKGGGTKNNKQASFYFLLLFFIRKCEKVKNFLLYFLILNDLFVQWISTKKGREKKQ